MGSCARRNTQCHPGRCMRPPCCLANITHNAEQWKVLVADEQSKKLLDNVLKEDDILNENITSVYLQFSGFDGWLMRV